MTIEMSEATVFNINDIHPDIILNYIAPHFKFDNVKCVYLSGLMRNTNVSPDDMADVIVNNDSKLRKYFEIAKLTTCDALNYSSLSYRVFDAIMYNVKNLHLCPSSFVENQINFDMNDIDKSKIQNTISAVKVINMYRKNCSIFMVQNMVKYMTDVFLMHNNGVNCLLSTQKTFIDTLLYMEHMCNFETDWKKIPSNIVYGIFERYQFATQNYDSNNAFTKSMKPKIEDNIFINLNKESILSIFCFFIKLLENMMPCSLKIEFRTKFYVVYEFFRCFNEFHEHCDSIQPFQGIASKIYRTIRIKAINKAYYMKSNIKHAGLPKYLKDLVVKELNRAIDWKRNRLATTT
jgi:hypothetical protein